MSDREVCQAAISGLFESGDKIWQDGGERDALAYVGEDWKLVRKYDRRVIAYERKKEQKRAAPHPSASQTPSPTAATPVAVPPAWISVKDRLPETDCDVLAYRVGAGSLPSWIEIARCFTDRRTRQWVGHVTHWMPLPEPPKGV